MKSEPKLSKAGKMPCKSWSLQAITTCPGSLKSNPEYKGELVDACKGCYATEGNYRFKNVKNVRLHNQQDWKADDWVDAMVKLIGNDPFFRWFDSGDCYQIKLAHKILAVMKATPDTRHWLPTRMHKFDKFSEVFDQMNALPNVVVRLSSDSIFGDVVDGLYSSTIVAKDSQMPDQSTKCEAYTRAGKCGDCRACWSKDVPVIVYPQHGQSMARLSLKLAA